MAWPINTKVIPKSCAGLDFHAIEAELIKTSGNITASAKTLGVPSADLRKLVWSTKLADTVYEAIEETLDEAQQIVRDALESEDKTHRLQAAKAMLTQTIAGKRRGWGREGLVVDALEELQPVATIKWLEN
jgi:hypothetical protein